MSEEMHGQNQSNEKRGGISKGGVVTLIVIGVAIIVLLIVIVVILTGEKGNGQQIGTQPSEEKRNVVVTESNVEEVIEQMSETELLPITYYEVAMTTNWHFANGDAVSEDAHVENVVSNSTDVYFDLFLASDENEAIYKSPVIQRGGILEQIALDKHLEKGKYDCVCVYHLIDEEQNTLSTLRVTLTVSVEN